MKKSKGTGTLLAGTLVILAVFFLFLTLDSEKTLIDWLAILFLLLAIAMTTIGLLTLDLLYYETVSEKKKKITVYILSGYLTIATITSLLFMGRTQLDILMLVILQILLIVALAIFILLSNKTLLTQNGKQRISEPSKLQRISDSIPVLKDLVEDDEVQKVLGEIQTILMLTDKKNETRYDENCLSVFNDLKGAIQVKEGVLEQALLLKDAVKEREYFLTRSTK